MSNALVPRQLPWRVGISAGLAPISHCREDDNEIRAGVLRLGLRLGSMPPISDCLTLPHRRTDYRRTDAPASPSPNSDLRSPISHHAFQTWPGLAGIPDMALRVSTMQGAHSANCR